MPDLPRVLIHLSEPAQYIARLTTAYPDLSYEVCETLDALPEAIQRFRPDIVYTVRFSSAPYPREALFGDLGPQWIANGGAGTDHLGRWDPARVTVTNAAGVASDIMAEYVMGGFLHFTLDVVGLQRDKAARHWDAERRVKTLSGRTLLIVGLGHTGRALAARAKAFGMQVIGTRARPQAMDNVDRVEPASALKDLVPDADFISVCTPLTDQTRGLISAEVIASMKPGAIFADVSRGGVTDQSALHDALTSQQLAAAVLDVFEVEPLPAASPLWMLENVILSPHCSAVHDGWGEASFDLFLTNLERWISAQPLLNIVDPNRGY